MQIQFMYTCHFNTGREGRGKMQQLLMEATKEPAVKMIALYDYNPTETSPNPDSEVSGIFLFAASMLFAVFCGF